MRVKHRRYREASLFAAVLVSLLSRHVDAEEAEIVPRHRITYEILLAGQYNGLGAILVPELRYRFRLHNSASPLKRDAHLGVGVVSSTTPTVSRLGAFVVVKPLTVVGLTAGYYFDGWFGTFGNVQSFEHLGENYFISDTDFNDTDRRTESPIGHEAFVRLHLLGALGPIVLSNSTEADYTALALGDNARLYYNPVFDLLVPNKGWFLINTTDLVFITPVGLIGGVRAVVGHAFYRDADFEDGHKKKNSESPTVSIGPIAAFTFYDHPGSLFNKPTIIFIAGWWLRHPYRTGQEVSRGLPSLILAFTIEGDIWSRD